MVVSELVESEIFMEEEWRELVDFPNYCVSNKGRVKSVDHTTMSKTMKVVFCKGRILKQQSRGSLYKFVSIKNTQGHFVCKDVHRLVAQAFIPNPLNKQQVNHIDGNRTNNNVDNLEWVSAKENMQHAFRTGLINKQTQINAHLYNARPVVKVKNGKIVEKFKSIKETARSVGTNPNSIKYTCCHSKTHIYRNYEFYLEEDFYGESRISD